MKIWREHGRTGEVAFRDQGHGSPVVLLHAFPLDSAMFTPQQSIVNPPMRWICPDLGSFGQSRSAGAWTVDSQADLLADWLASIVPRERIVLGGVSMGGYVALAFARRHPRMLRGLVLIDTRAEPDSPEAQANRGKSIELVQSQGTAALVENMLPKVLGSTTWQTRPNVVEQVRSWGARQSPVAVVQALQALRDRPDARPSLADLALPTLVVVGQEDTLTPLAAAEVLANGIRGAKLVELPGVGHLPNLEDPALFNSTLAQFLASLPADPSQ